MISKLLGWDDTIVALATPPGIGALGVIRVSGNRSIEIMNNLFPSKDLLKQPSHTLHVGFLKNNIEGNTDKILDEVVISIYKNPTSYTGEDIIEISCHGSAYIQQQIMNVIVANGARLAKAGEFTQRAFLNGKLDLTQAEAVADLIASNTEASQKAALHNIRGGFSHVLTSLREQLIQFSSLIELELDFSEEDVEFADRAKFSALIEELLLSSDKLLHSFRLGNVIKNGVTVAIVGKPNAGKSTLLNTLLNENRAIVSEIAGTTRDTVEEIINIKGILFRLIDTAGIRDVSTDVIENMGVIKSHEKIKSADVVLYLFDVVDEIPGQLEKIAKDLLEKNKNFILVATKADLAKEEIKTLTENTLLISAKNNTGIEELKHALFKSVLQDQSLTENTIVTNLRHYQALQQMVNSLKEIKSGLNNRIPADLLSLDIRRCLNYLGEITGEVTNEDRLDFIFSKFCIGK